MKMLRVCICLLMLAACSGTEEPEYRTLQVTATAYNSTEAQTKKGNIGIAAWGDTLKPGMKAIAVSRDLIDSGLTRNTVVKIEGRDGYYRVLDKMNRRWTKKIDIYMGLDRDSAMQWGRREVWISWEEKEESQ